jgi:type I restriction enzyme S subunit
VNWKTVQLKDVATVSAGNSAPQADALFESGTFNFYRTSDVGRIRKGLISDSLDKLNNEGIKGLKKFEVGTILFPKSGASTFLNHRVMLEKEGYVSSHLAGIKAKNELLNDKFLFYYLTTIDSKNLVQDSNYPSLKTTSIEKIQFQLPPLEIQEKLAVKLDALFNEIEKAITVAKANAKNSDSLFQNLLITIFEEGIKHWDIKKLNQISENLDSKRIPITKGVRQEGNIPYYGASGIVDYVKDFIFDDDILLISEDGANLLARTYPIAFSVNGKCWVNNHAHVVKFTKIVTQKFVEFYLNSISLSPYVSGMAQPKLNQAMLNKIPIPLPNVEEQSRLVNLFEIMKESTSTLKNSYIEKVSQLISLKQSILQQAFNGELVKELN